MVASGFLLRAIAGGVATGIPLSQWFLLVAAFGSFFMVAGKRYSEMKAIGGEAGTRRSLTRYSESYLRFAWMLAAVMVLISYSLWAFENRGRRRLRRPLDRDLDRPVYVGAVAICAGGRHRQRRRAGGGGVHDHVLQGIGVLWLVVISVAVFYGERVGSSRDRALDARGTADDPAAAGRAARLGPDLRAPCRTWRRSTPSPTPSRPCAPRTTAAWCRAGLGRSYGDAAQNAGGITLDLTRMNKILSVDAGAEPPTVTVAGRGQPRSVDACGAAVRSVGPGAAGHPPGDHRRGDRRRRARQEPSHPGQLRQPRASPSTC